MRDGKIIVKPFGKKKLDESLRVGNHAPMTLAEYLRTKGVKPSRFAAEIGVAASTITRILNEDRMPRREVLRKIAAGTKGRVKATDFVGVPE